MPVSKSLVRRIADEVRDTKAAYVNDSAAIWASMRRNRVDQDPISGEIYREVQKERSNRSRYAAKKRKKAANR